jgi:hypothetical protein
MADVEQWEVEFRCQVAEIRQQWPQVMSRSSPTDVERYIEWIRFLWDRIPSVRAGRSYYSLSDAERRTFCRLADEWMQSRPGYWGSVKRVNEALRADRMRCIRSVYCSN